MAAYVSMLSANNVNVGEAAIAVVDVIVTVSESRRRVLTAGVNNFLITFVFEITNIPTGVAATVCRSCAMALLILCLD